MLGFELSEGLFAGAAGLLDSIAESADCWSTSVFFNDADRTGAAEPGRACGLAFVAGSVLSDGSSTWGVEL